MTIDLRLPAPSRKELIAIGGAAALAVSGLVDGPAALVLAAVPLVRSHLTPARNERAGTVRAMVDVEPDGSARRARRTTTASTRSNGTARRRTGTATQGRRTASRRRTAATR